MKRVLLGAAMVLALAAPAFAQDRKETLADVRKELAQLSAQLQSLRSELVASGSQGMQAAGGASALQRMDTMEASISRLTSQTEALQNRVNRVVADGTNRIGDLEFRLCELEDGCDPGSIGNAPLGGAAPAADSASLTAPAPNSAAPKGDLTVNEQSDFDRAKGVLGQGDFRGAADLFATFTQTYPGGPLTPDAGYLRGDALNRAGDVPGAARAWLDAFSADPEGRRAADNLLELGKALGALGQHNEACTSLGEVQARFPGSEAAGRVPAAKASLGCM
ncbi:tol-pal system protein YbgF [Sinirhodobacter populi]|uniref:Cell division coordinator CpoB n=2 Tax=Paenirhodobacter populi TaxID=2306993 RepID=A0A443KCS1_9RHOB|nr:tol-pal system protein YbgF [Sinirhodobacter populi]RWR08931.1 tol-pal system protein YbgF [Sinirhodobacter populi]RWR30413.1 tol-pal system protein YbgF [Sinirhodobacter populi]